MSGTLRLLSAGAGAGKTYSLSQSIVEAIQSGVPAEKIMATTFTIKAAEELTERVRNLLLAAGDTESAVRILDGYVGTMNSVFGRLLREFALEMGLSPEQTVLPEDEAKALFQTVVDEVIRDYYRKYADVFCRLQMDDERNGWTTIVQKIIEIARQNGMDPSVVRRCADSSWTRLKTEVLPEPLGDGAAIDRSLRQHLDFICEAGPADGDTTKGTAGAVQDLKEIRAKWERHGELYWNEWAKVGKTSPGKKSEEHFAPLLQAAALHDRHPRLHKDLHDAIEGLFHCAADAMDRYQSEKAKRGFVDFTDQEALALQLLTDKQCEGALKDRMSHVFVDEFQDCSPLQLALISRLRELTTASAWVGDVKQAIFGFRGTDPTLMTEAMARVDHEAVTVLGDSYRSRASLVEFVNAVFIPVFETMGLAKSQVELSPQRKDKEGQAPSLEVWLYPQSKKRGSDPDAVALGVKRFLEDRGEHLVEDKVNGRLRPVRPSDIAILCRFNDECESIADSLAKRGLRATVGEGGLLSTPEAVLTVASFRYLVDERDTLALAEILHFSSDEWGNGRWLEPWINAEDPVEAFSAEALVHALDYGRSLVRDMSPTEVLDLAISTARVQEIAMAWGDADQRVANLDAVRRLAKQYEDKCAVNGTAATTSGLLRFLQDTRTKDNDLNRIADSKDENAIRVITYHRAKGLEWPVIILSTLHSPYERVGPPLVFNQVRAVTAPDWMFDFSQPLAGRDLYYWPWPYGKQSKDVGLDGHVDGLDLLVEAKRLALEENIRLMYVGMTRARDYLIFATKDPAKALWLKELQDKSGVELINLPTQATVSEDQAWASGVDSSIGIRGVEYPCRLRILYETEDMAYSEVSDASGPDVQAHADTEDVARSSSADLVATPVYVAKVDEATLTAFPPSRFQPSKFAGQLLANDSADASEPDAVSDSTVNFTDDFTIDPVGDVVEIGGRIPMTGQVEMDQLGDLVHAFLAADNVGRMPGERTAFARELQNRFKIHVITADALVEVADRLARFIGERYPNVTAIHREWPMHIRKGLQKSSGWMDLVLEMPEGWILIDHKTFPGPPKTWVDKANIYLPQLQIYSAALTQATNKPVLQAWIHMPVVGVMVGFKQDELVLSEVPG